MRICCKCMNLLFLFKNIDSIGKKLLENDVFSARISALPVQYPSVVTWALLHFFIVVLRLSQNLVKVTERLCSGLLQKSSQWPPTERCYFCGICHEPGGAAMTKEGNAHSQDNVLVLWVKSKEENLNRQLFNAVADPVYLDVIHFS